MGKRIQRFIEQLSAHIQVWQWLGFGGVVTGGTLSAFFASASMWLDQYGPIGWWFAVLVGALVGLLIGVALAWLRYLIILGGATRRWSERIDHINPLDTQFSRQRIRLADLAHPVDGSIKNKTFIDCDLVGPANVLLFQDVTLQEMGFIDCDVVVAVPGVPIKNVTAFERVTMLRGNIFRCFVIIPPMLVPTFQAMGTRIITAIPRPIGGNQSPQGTEEKSRS